MAALKFIATRRTLRSVFRVDGFFVVVPDVARANGSVCVDVTYLFEIDGASDPCPFRHRWQFRFTGKRVALAGVIDLDTRYLTDAKHVVEGRDYLTRVARVAWQERAAATAWSDGAPLAAAFSALLWAEPPPPPPRKPRTAAEEFNRIAERLRKAARPGPPSVPRHVAEALELLGLPGAALPTDDELPRAWRVAAAATHPDRGGTSAAFVRAKNAHETVVDHLSRRVGRAATA